MTRRLVLVMLAFAVATIADGNGSQAAGDDGAFEVIVHPDSRLSSIDRDTLRDIYLRKIVEWDRGGSIHPIDLPAGTPARDRFEREVIRKTPSQLKNYWDQQIFSGKGTPPLEADSAQSAIEYVREHPGAIAYVPVGADARGTKVLRVD